MDVSKITKPALATEIAMLGKKVQELKAELIRQQIIAAVRLDTIRLLAFVMNRDASQFNPLAVTPQAPEVRKIMANELVDLGKHLRDRANDMDLMAKRLLTEEDIQESE